MELNKYGINDHHGHEEENGTGEIKKKARLIFNYKTGFFIRAEKFVDNVHILPVSKRILQAAGSNSIIDSFY